MRSTSNILSMVVIVDSSFTLKEIRNPQHHGCRFNWQGFYLTLRRLGINRVVVRAKKQNSKDDSKLTRYHIWFTSLRHKQEDTAQRTICK
mmetsp:Transcript_60328/g.148039  ORF Transcript_60328/g.148039 Transcript_60328/m.148039 type:complete len:90 (-) Transcript_60328:24-293(-)